MLANPGLSKAEGYGVRQFANFLCAALPFEMAIKAEGYGVRLSHELPLRPLFLLKWLSKTEGDGVRLPHELPLRPLFLLKWLSKAEGDGVRLLHKSCKHPLPASPLSLERGWG